MNFTIVSVYNSRAEARQACTDWRENNLDFWSGQPYVNNCILEKNDLKVTHWFYSYDEYSYAAGLSINILNYNSQFTHEKMYWTSRVRNA